ncbi:alpha/beta fold hydrolase [Nitriliruptoraceae bacterium ZYF776]|nr:alpha/beta fold hydrolase [Profundirhabdus halotolerans]
MSTRPRRLASAIAAAGLLSTTLAVPAAAQAEPDPLPIVFVHGNSGSAQQFQTQFQRFTSNGYPQELLFAFEYDTGQTVEASGEATDAALDVFIDDVLAATGADEVHLVGHSRGTIVSTFYLDDFYATGDDRPSKVASYVGIDGRDMPTLPGGVPTIGLWGERNSGGEYSRRGDELAFIGPDPDANFHAPDQGHTEVASSASSFAIIHEFLTGDAPTTTDVVPQRPSEVTVAGRATIFPANVGYPGATLELWRVDPATGQRVGTSPRAATALDATGAFGPWPVNGDAHYAFTLTHPDGSQHHFHRTPFRRSDHFVRLQTGIPGQGIDAFVPKSEDHVTVNIVRQREMWGDQGAGSDVVAVDGLDVAAPNIAPRGGTGGEVLALFLHDVGTDRTTDLDAGVPPPFGSLPFLSAADVFLPATTDGSDGIEVSVDPRGDASARETIVVPNLPSTGNRLTVELPDRVQPAVRWAAYPGSGATACPAGYPDLPATGYVHTATICALSDAALARGRADGRFRPQSSVTRGQVATLVAGALDLDTRGASGFPDVPSDDVHAGAIGALAEADVLVGYRDGTFGSGDPVTRGQLATVVAKALGVDGAGEARFPDVPAGYVHAPAISALADRGVLLGRDDGRFDPQASITRGQTASTVVRGFALR